MKVLLLLATATAVIAACSPTDTPRLDARIVSPAGFEAAIPRGWTHISLVPPDGRILLSSSLDRVHGVGVAHGAADITISPADNDEVRRSIEQLERLDLQGDEVLAARELNPGPGPGSCSSLREVATKVEMGPATFMIHTALVCAIGDDRFLVLLRYWDGDPRGPEFRMTAIAAANSIRLSRAATALRR